MDLRAKIFEDTSYGRIAMKQFGEVPEGFRIYQVSLQGEHPNYHGIQVVGAEFRQAKSGMRKGQLCMHVKGTDRSTYVSNAAMKAEESKEESCKP